MTRFSLFGTLTSALPARLLSLCHLNVTVDSIFKLNMFLGIVFFFCDTGLQRKCYRRVIRWPPPDTSHCMKAYFTRFLAFSKANKINLLASWCQDKLPNIQIMYANCCWLLLINDSFYFNAWENIPRQYSVQYRLETCLMNSSLYSNQLLLHVHYNEQQAAVQTRSKKSKAMSGRPRLICIGFVPM